MAGDGNLCRDAPVRRHPRLLMPAGPGLVLLAFALLLLTVPSAGAAQRRVRLAVSYRGLSCASGERTAMHPLGHTKITVRAGRKTIRRRLNGRGVAVFRLSRRVRRLRVTVRFEGELLEVDPYQSDRSYSWTGVKKLSRRKRSYRLRIETLAQAGAASIWTILSRGADFAEAAMPDGLRLPRVRVRYGPNHSTPPGNPVEIESESGDWAIGSAYDQDHHEMLVESRKRAEEFEPWVLLHEYGHHLLGAVASPGSSSGGTHDLEYSYPERPAMAWSEGFAHAFAALSRHSPVLGTRCRKGINLSGTPAVPRSKSDPWLNAYHEISVAGVVWQLVEYLDRVKHGRGLKTLLGALGRFGRAYGVESLRDARDALSHAGFDDTQSGFSSLTSAFDNQRIGWGMELYVSTNDFRSAGPGDPAQGCPGRAARVRHFRQLPDPHDRPGLQHLSGRPAACGD